MASKRVYLHSRHAERVGEIPSGVISMLPLRDEYGFPSLTGSRLELVRKGVAGSSETRLSLCCVLVRDSTSDTHIHMHSNILYKYEIG